MKKIVYSLLASTVVVLTGVFTYRYFNSVTIESINDLFSKNPTAAGKTGADAIIFQASKGSSLAQSLNELAKSGNIVFKINTDISKNAVAQNVSASDWDTAIKELLVGYNYSVIAEDKSKTVIISGYNGDAPKIATTSIRDQIVFAPALGTIATQFQNYPAGTVLPVNIPIDALFNMKAGTSADFDLPIGNFNTTHDSTTSDAVGNKTWVGHLSNEGVGYRMMLSQGAAGVMGHVTTPEGTYDIASSGESTYLIDTRKFKSAGYEGDTVAPENGLLSSTMDNAVQADDKNTHPSANNNNTENSNLQKLQADLDAAKKANDAAQALANTNIALNNQVIAEFNQADSNFQSATAMRNSATETYNTALNTFVSNQSAANQAALSTANSNLSNANAAYSAAFSAYQSALSTKNTIATATAIKVDAATKAQAAYDSALKALTEAQNTPIIPKSTEIGLNKTAPASSNTPENVIDLMVLYTTETTTAEYAKQRIQYLVTVSNQAYKDSGINASLRLVYAEPTTYNESVSNSQALSDLANDRGVFVGTKDKRKQYGADLVFLFRPLYAKSHGSCGTTYVGFAKGSPANKATGYGTISDGTAKDNSPGYFCEINTAPHEIGHSFGLVHDREYSSNPGAYSYSYAWGIQGKFGTIMSYKTPVVMLFSSPKLTNQCASGVCGYDEADATQSSDQVKSANLTVPQIAAYFPTSTSAPLIK